MNIDLCSLIWDLRCGKINKMYRYNAKVVKVIDGDTIDAEIDLGFSVKIKKRIRLAGIDAPESRTRNLAEKKQGLASKARLKELLEGSANEFELESTELGKYGRVIGKLHISQLAGKDTITQVCVNDKLIKEGYAVEYDGGKR
jgi:micrococcal nuclease